MAADPVEQNLYDIPTENQTQKLEKGLEEELQQSLTSLKESLDTLEEVEQNVYDVVPEGQQQKTATEEGNCKQQESSTNLQDSLDDDEESNIYDTVPEDKQRKLKKEFEPIPKPPQSKPPAKSTTSLKEALQAAEELDMYETMTTPKNQKEERESVCSTVTMENTLYSVTSNPTDETTTFYEATRHVSRKFDVSADAKQQQTVSDQSEKKEEKSPGPSKWVLLAIVIGIIAVAILSISCTVVTFTEIAKLKSETRVAQPTSTTNNGLLDFACTDCEEAILNISTQISLLQGEISSLDAIKNNLTEVSLIQPLLQEQIESLVNVLGDRGLYQSFPWSSCSEIPTSYTSGYYWIRNTVGSAVRVFCNTNRTCGNITGGWRRVGYLDTRDDSSICPTDLRQQNHGGIRTCSILNTTTASTCSSVLFPVVDMANYSHVCGRISAYQFGTTNAFRFYYIHIPDINSEYVDGISLTYGKRPLRHHIWTFAAALDNNYNEQDSDTRHYCPCQTGSSPPPFVGNDYFCDSGSDEFILNQPAQLYGTDPLWDGAGCSGNNTCCSLNTPPWFYKQLPQPTTDDIEMRVCRNEVPSNEDIAIVEVEIYVQ